MKETINFDDNIAIVPVELARDEQVPGEAIAVFAVMKSFGPRAEAKVETFATRLKWSVAKVRKYQGILEKAGWIVLVREGAKVSQGSYLPRLWWMARVKGQQPPQELGVGVTKTETPTKYGSRKVGGLKSRGPKNRNPEAVEGSSNSRRSSKQQNEREGADAPPSPKASPKGPEEQAEGILCRLDKIRVATSYGRPIVRTKENLRAALEAEANYGHELGKAYINFLGDKSLWLTDRNHPLTTFAKQPDSYLPKHTQKAASPAPATKSIPPISPETPYTPGVPLREQIRKAMAEPDGRHA